MKLLYLTEYFNTPEDAGLMRSWELSRNLTTAGHTVHVIVPAAHHVSGQMPPELRGRLYLQRTIAGIKVTKVWVWSAFRRGKLDRLLYYLTTAIAVSLASLRDRPDVLLCSSPPFFLAPVAYLLARVRKVPFVLEVRDAWLEFAVAKGLVPRFAVPILEAEQRWLFRRADRIVAVTPGICEIILASLPESHHDKVLLVMNGYEDDVFEGADPARAEAIRQEWNLGGKFVAIFAGTMGMARDCLTIARAATRLRAHTDIVFAFVGDGEQRVEIEKFIARERLTNCLLVRMQPRQDMPAWFANCAVGLNAQRGGEALESSLGNKIFDYLGAGIPVVWSGSGDTNRFLEESKGGLAVAPEDDEAMAAAILKLRRDARLRKAMGRRGQRYVIDNFSRSKLVVPLEAMLVNLVRNRGKAELEAAVKRP